MAMPHEKFFRYVLIAMERLTPFNDMGEGKIDKSHREMHLEFDVIEFDIHKFDIDIRLVEKNVYGYYKNFYIGVVISNHDLGDFERMNLGTIDLFDDPVVTAKLLNQMIYGAF